MSQFQSGSEVPFIKSISITRDTLKQYSIVSGDPNPIHLDDDVAKKMGLPGVIAHGMLIAAMIAERAQLFVGNTYRLDLFECRFTAMTFPDDEIQIGGIIDAVTENEVVFKLFAKNQKLETVNQAKVKMIKN